jgi:hypothetical protein
MVSGQDSPFRNTCGRVADRWLVSDAPVDARCVARVVYPEAGIVVSARQVHPIANADALRGALAAPSHVPRYISYRGLTASSVVLDAGGLCPTVIQTFPEWFARLAGAGLLADAQFVTICGPI